MSLLCREVTRFGQREQQSINFHLTLVCNRLFFIFRRSMVQNLGNIVILDFVTATEINMRETEKFAFRYTTDTLANICILCEIEARYDKVESGKTVHRIVGQTASYTIKFTGFVRPVLTVLHISFSYIARSRDQAQYKIWTHLKCRVLLCASIALFDCSNQS